MPSSFDPTPPDLPPAVPAFIDPARFEDFEGFRETTLAVFMDPTANAALRALGDLLYTMALEYTRHWPHEPDGSFFHQVRAVLADLRHLEGWLGHLDTQRAEASLSAEEEPVSILCGTFVPALKAIGDALELKVCADPDAPPPLDKAFTLCDPLPFEEQREAARYWVIKKWIRGAGEGDGNVRLLRELREAADRVGSFSFYHVLGLEMLALLRENKTETVFASHGGPELVEHFLGAADVPAEVRAYYAAGKGK